MTRLLFFDAVTSTNTVLADVARAGGAPNTALVARVQTAGRGQGTREWTSPSGGLWMSTLVTDPVLPDHAGWLPLATGVSVCEAIEAVTEAAVEPRVKWPNDILVDDKKVGGVLVESSIREDRLAWAVVGTGINVDNDPPLEAATTLKDHGYDGGPRALAQAIADRVVARAGQLARDGPDEVRVDWMQRQVVIGRHVATPEAEGRAVDVGPGGELVLETDDGRVLVRTGPVRFVE